MAHPVFWTIVVLAKLAVIFKMGQKHNVSQMKEAAEKEMAEQRIPRECVQEIMRGINAKIKDDRITFLDFCEAFFEVINEIKSDAISKAHTTIDFMTDVADDARDILVGLLRKAADSVDSQKDK